MSSLLSPQKKPLWFRLIRWGLNGLALLFIVLTAKKLLASWDGAPLQISWFWVLLSLPFCLLALVAQAAAWVFLLQDWKEPHRLVRGPAFRIYFAGQLARYTPGKVGLPAVRLAGASELGVSAAWMGSSLLVEILTWCLSGVLLSSLVLLFYPEALTWLPGPTWLLLPLLAAGALLGLLLFTALPRARLPHKLQTIIPQSTPGPLLPRRALGLFLIHWLAWTFHGSLLALGLGAPLSSAGLIGATYSMSLILGFLALLAPAGAGVREAIIAWGATPILGASGALALGLLARAISLVLEILLWLSLRLRKPASPP